jgi:hypothetical protein
MYLRYLNDEPLSNLLQFLVKILTSGPSILLFRDSRKFKKLSAWHSSIGLPILPKAHFHPKKLLNHRYNRINPLLCIIHHSLYYPFFGRCYKTNAFKIKNILIINPLKSFRNRHPGYSTPEQR